MKENFKVGDRLKIELKDHSYEGILLPRNELSGEDHIIVKLNSGYNIGIKKENIKKIKKIPEKKVLKPQKKVQIMGGHLPAISLIATGGTISSRVDYKTGGVFPYTKPEELFLDIPQLGNYVKISNLLSPFAILSEDMASAEWINLAEIVCKELKKDVEGVIVTHGTDTLHYTAAALSFMIKNLNKPVAVTGAQRSPDRGSFDGTMNLLCAAHYCLSDIAETSIVMHGTTEDDHCLAMRGTKVRKMHSSRRDAFRPINELPLAKIWPDGNTVIENSGYKSRSESKPELDAKFDEKVVLIHTHPNMSPEILDFYTEKKYHGVVLAGTGFGHVPMQPFKKEFSWEKSIKRAVDAGVFVAGTTQCIYGRTDLLVYSAGRLMEDAGVISMKDMFPEVAYIKLGWALAHTRDREKVKDLMLKNIAGEFNDRLSPDTFLY